MLDSGIVAMELQERGFQNLGEVKTFKGYRQGASGDPQRVTVEIWENLTEDMPRYWIEARDEHGRIAAGNGHDELHLALAGVHWHNLDP